MLATTHSIDRFVVERTSPFDIVGWNGLAADRPFYVTADWLRYSDSDHIAESRFYGLLIHGDLVAALPAHLAPAEHLPEYVAARTLAAAVADEAGRSPVLTLGGRRGYLSDVLASRDPACSAGHLSQLMERALEQAQARHWWWPYLPAPAAQVVANAGRMLSATGEVGVHLINADCVIDIVGTCLQDHVASLNPRQRRTNFRREDSRFLQSPLELREISFADHVEHMVPLLANVQKKYGRAQDSSYLAPLLRNQVNYLSDRAVVFGCFNATQLIGFSLCYAWSGQLALRMVGLDYEHLIGAAEYPQLSIHAPLRYCYQHGFRRFHLGIGSAEAKVRRGGRARALWAITSLPGQRPQDTRAVATRLAQDLPAHESEEFLREASEAQI